MRLPRSSFAALGREIDDRRTGVLVPPSVRIRTASASRTSNTAPNLAVHCVAKMVHVWVARCTRVPVRHRPHGASPRHP